MFGLLLKLWRAMPFGPNGKLRIVRLFTDQFLIGTTGIFFNDKNEILLVKHTYRSQDRWSLPGGYIRSKEHPKEALEREVYEETGLVVSADEKLKIRTDRDFARLDIMYIGKYLYGAFKPSKEVSDAGFFSSENLPLLPRDQLIFVTKAYETR